MDNKKSKSRRNFKLTTITMVSVFGAALTLSAVASSDNSGWSGWNIPYSDIGNTPLNSFMAIGTIHTGNYAYNDPYNQILVHEAEIALENENSSKSAECADPSNPNGVAYKQLKRMKEAREEDDIFVDLNKIFQIGKANGCFDAVGRILDLSIHVPSLDSIKVKTEQELKKHAERELCAVNNEIIKTATKDIEIKIEGIASRKYLDLSGKINEVVNQNLYKLVDKHVTDIHKEKIIFKW